MSTQTKTKRIMREFEIGEISAVDRPSQGHARMTIMKHESKEKSMQKITRDELLAFPTFEAAVAQLRKIHKLTGTQAMSRAARDHPALLKRYNEEAIERHESALAAVEKAGAKPRAVTDFEMIVDSMVQRDGVSRFVAMQRARRENPDLFAAYQSA